MRFLTVSKCLLFCDGVKNGFVFVQFPALKISGPGIAASLRIGRRQYWSKASRMSKFVTRLNVVSGKMEWGLLDDDYDYWQEIARSRYGDMLHDTERNVKYSIGLKKAIDAVHARGQKANVLDIGTGTGLLAMLAVRHGADSVTACEAFEPVAQAARLIIEDNGMVDKIKLIMKRSTAIRVPEDLEQRCNILVSEVFDTELIGEGALGVFIHAHENLLTEDVITVPYSATVYIQVVQSDFLLHHNHLADNTGLNVPVEWKDCPGPASVHDVQLSQLYPRQDFRRLSETHPVYDFVFCHRNNLRFHDEKTIQLMPLGMGRCDAIFLWWDLKMDPEGEVILTCAPSWAQQDATGIDMALCPWRDHWMQAVYHLTPQLKIHPGNPFYVHSVHDEYSFNFCVSHSSDTSKEHLKHLVCSCYSHLVMNRSRMAMLGNVARLKFWARTLQKMSSPHLNLLYIGSPSNLPILATKQSWKNIFIIENDHLASQVFKTWLKANDADSRITIIEKLTDLVSDIDLDGQKIDVIVSEPYFTNALLPWQHMLILLSYVEHLRPHLSPNFKMVPWEARIRGCLMDFDDLWKIRAPVGSVEGIDLRKFDQLVELAMAKADSSIEPQPLWEYPGKILSEIFTVHIFDLDRPLVKDFLSVSGSVEAVTDGAYNGIAFWVEYSFPMDGTDMVWTTGLDGIPLPGEYVRWNPYHRQGVYLARQSRKIRKGDRLLYECLIDYESGEMSGKFNFVDANPVSESSKTVNEVLTAIS
ncbi:protein arginine N-methyltransferase 7-like isoform X2 [Paramacrobiotus metropolitanus]|uniref:protein arginine N-methyltransferase 7-like isoform X2 n=1 Tax=Paramacrobiotus metropolitanus TaxID=2943436 RepID=UPI0024462A33|nr:protein arginine N-methyltransferase 7-like isoform X2 [Paramacrobiotus metropolitanus]